MTCICRWSKATCCAGLMLICFYAVTASGVLVGPAIQKEEGSTALPMPGVDQPLKSRMNIPSMRFAVPVLDANIPSNVEVQLHEGIWPELRRIEAVRSAIKIREHMRTFNQFDSLVVSPNASVSADVFLLGSIIESNGELLAIRYEVVDARGVYWIPPRTVKHRVPVGWHERHENVDVDPFDPLYYRIAESVYEVLKDKAKKHVKRIEKNKSLEKGESPRMSEIDRIVATRALVFAQFFSPEEYGPSLSVKGGVVDIKQLPDMDGKEWSRIESVKNRDDAFTGRVNAQYDHFVAEIDDSYDLWQKDSFVVAREMRLKRRSRDLKAIGGGVLIIASAAAALDGAAREGDHSATAATSLGALGGSALIASSFVDNAHRRDAVDQLNELSKSMHDSYRQTRISLDGEIRTLTGTAQEQFIQWRELLNEIYHDEGRDLQAVKILDDERKP